MLVDGATRTYSIERYGADSARSRKPDDNPHGSGAELQDRSAGPPSVSLARAKGADTHCGGVHATTGVLGVIVEQSTGYVYAAFEVMVDGAGLFLVGHHRKYYAPVSAGDLSSPWRPLSLHAGNWTTAGDSDIGGLIRDTVEVGFSVACDPPSGRGTRRILHPRPVQYRLDSYTVLHEVYGYWDYGGTPTYLGDLEPNGTLIATVAPSFGEPCWNLIHLTGVPANCRVSGPNPTDRFTVMLSETIDIEFTVVCSH